MLVITDVSAESIGPIFKVQSFRKEINSWTDLYGSCSQDEICSWDCLSLEDVTDRLSRNVGNYQFELRQVPEERWSNLHSGRRFRSRWKVSYKLKSSCRSTFNEGRHIVDGTGWMFVVSVMLQLLYPRRGTPARIEREAGLPPHPTWALYRGGTSLAPLGSRTPGRPADKVALAVPGRFWGGGVTKRSGGLETATVQVHWPFCLDLCFLPEPKLRLNPLLIKLNLITNRI